MNVALSNASLVISVNFSATHHQFIQNFLKLFTTTIFQKKIRKVSEKSGQIIGDESQKKLYLNYRTSKLGG